MQKSIAEKIDGINRPSFTDGFLNWVSLENLIYMTIFLLPTYLIKLQFSFFRTNILELLILVITLCWIATSYRAEKIVRLYLNYKKYIISGAIMLTGLFLSSFLHVQIWQSLGIVKSWFLLPLVFMLITADVIAKEKIKQVFFVYGWSAFFVATIAWGYFCLGQLTYDGRLTAFFNSPNYLAMYLAPGVIIGYWRLSRLNKGVNSFPQKKASLYGQFISLAVTLGALFFTTSYATFAAMFLGVLVILWADDSLRSGRTIWLSFLVLSLFALVFFVSQLGSVKFNSLITANPRSSLASRVMIWQSSLRMISHNPLFGIGPANFQTTYLEYQKYYPPYLEWAVPHPQNLYFDFWLSGGILGMGGFLGLLFFLFQKLLRNKNQNTLNILVLGLMVYVLVHGFFDTTYFKNDLAIIFWLNFLVLK